MYNGTNRHIIWFNLCFLFVVGVDIVDQHTNCNKNTTCRLCDNRKYYYNIQKQMHVVVKVAVRKKLCDVVDIINQCKLL